MKSVIINLLRRRCKRILAKHKPFIIAITGSQGKTSTKNAIAIALRGSKKIRSAKKNFNNEIGVPLAILGEESPGRSIYGWLGLFWRSFNQPLYPEVLILEFGADKPGDIKELCELAPPNISVVTGISPVHAEFFQDISHLIQEKGEIVAALKKDGIAILNGDDKNVMSMRARTNAAIRTYGLSSTEYSAKDIRLEAKIDDNFQVGETFVVTKANIKGVKGQIGEMEVKNVIGYAPTMAVLAALAVADQLSISTTDALNRLNEHLSSQPGRLKPLAGIKGSLIIDDSYNAAPAAMQNGLQVLNMFQLFGEDDRKIAALGAMAELGQYSEDEHRLIGLKVAEVADIFVAVGEAMKVATAAAKEAGMDENTIHWFSNSKEAGRFLDAKIQRGDIIYVKGSQSTRMEWVVKDLMAQPLLAKDLLVRQEDKWLKNS